MTVTLTDSVQDQGFLYAFFEVKTDDNISMTDNTSFEEMTHFKIDGKEVYADDDKQIWKPEYRCKSGQDVLLKTRSKFGTSLNILQHVYLMTVIMI